MEIVDRVERIKRLLRKQTFELGHGYREFTLKTLRSRGQSVSSGRSHEELVVEDNPQLAQRPAHCRLTHVGTLGRARHMPFLQERDERSEEVQIYAKNIHLANTSYMNNPIDA